MFVSRGQANYSPDNPATFAFCAFHASVNFSDVGHVLFTVEPFQNVPGCAVGKPSPNGVLVDSTASVLSHQLIETITDPDGDAWWITNDLDLFFAGDRRRMSERYVGLRRIEPLWPQPRNSAGILESSACVRLHATEIDSNKRSWKGHSRECPFCFGENAEIEQAFVVVCAALVR